MQDKTNNRKILMAMVGAYLVYTGGSLIMEVTKGKPENSVLFIVAGAVFVLFGCLTIFYHMKSYIAAVKADVVYTDDAESAEDAEEMEAVGTSDMAEQRHGNVEFVDLQSNHVEEDEVEDEVEDETEEDEEETSGVDSEGTEDDLIILDLSDIEK